MDSSYSDFQFHPGFPEPGSFSAAPYDGNMGGIPPLYQPRGLPSAAEKSGESAKLSKTAVVSALEAVKQRVTELEKQLAQCARQHDLLEVVAHQNIVIQSIHNSCEKRLNDMQQDFEMKLAGVLQTVEKGHGDGESSDEDDKEDEDEARIEASLEAKGDPGLLAVIRHAFSHMLGTVKLTAKDLPWWPKDGEEWPVDSATSEKFLRFRWGESHTHEDNYRGLQTIFRYIRTKGAEFSPTSAKALRAISDEDLLDRVQTKYQDLQKALRAAKLLSSSRVTTTTEASENQGALRDAKLSKGVRQSRQQGKCEVHERKFAALSNDSEFKTDAFKTALIPQEPIMLYRYINILL
ncbi:hypothetical protein DEU56DRAFT_754152 [Suillus clintonianus]|uniref:uncharacterized protein n=1 Tax=Suillus clintonianus TaxID=1904413 RepID=UPI001B88515B|nr:uncharacterized protein DEU56DRAFT_754152 [Suillus clintonianus]KAG2144480.1 hypothetical protein DEU56DRAFT_754152 [Suillus clintonianus]